MNIKTWIKYEVPYIPPRCRKARYEEREEFVEVKLREASKDKLVLAYEDTSYNGKGKIYRFAGRLWAKVKMPNLPDDELKRMRVKKPLDWIIYHNSHYSTYFACRFHDEDTSRDAMLGKAKRDMARFILIDGELYERTCRPEYWILTFGCGRGDGTGLFVEYPARRDCGRRFPATKGAEAVAKAKEIAKGRGDEYRHFKPYIICH